MKPLKIRGLLFEIETIISMAMEIRRKQTWRYALRRMVVTGIDHLVKATLVEDQNKALLNHANIQRQLRSSKENHKPVNRICCMALSRLGEHLVSWGTGLQRRFGNIAEAAV